MSELIPDSPLARFVFDEEKVRKDGNVKSSVFKPKRGDALSIFDVSGFNHEETCHHGHQ